MTRAIIPLLLSLMIVACGSETVAEPGSEAAAAEAETPEWRIVIHGGAGVILRENLSDEQEADYRAALEVALDAGAEVLKEGGTSVDAVQAAVLTMEDNTLFNAGKGAVLTAAREHELDASIMDGRDRNAGSVAGVKHVKNPILAARAVMDHSEHVMFAAQGADDFAESVGLETVENSYFTTERRVKALDRVLETRSRTDADRHGTVGAVAIDKDGNLAAATTTGGMTAKAPGRVGDSPLIGAATYAQNGVCAVSATGHGEYFIRVGVAKTICTRVELAGDSIGAAAENALDQVADLGGDGGVIVMGGEGQYDYVFNSKGMYRGMMDSTGAVETAIFEKKD
ncbi:isoaspartyl peptidase/L-asparaginase family protein [Henriciella aquimarina]|uniref:isoaspartyl peptidase/L-asparaginase family protein n=1 Tax=Henriciella aquimarina TaxID=545261 RepID=UPI001F1C18E0|nr:isoaspartyl peptidase/L-asparaginase [Henriciella aquimarina]